MILEISKINYSDHIAQIDPKCWDFEYVGKYEMANFSIKTASPMLGKRLELKGL